MITSHKQIEVHLNEFVQEKSKIFTSLNFFSYINMSIYMCNNITCNASYWAWSESLMGPALFPNSRRLDPTDLPRDIPPGTDLWCRHLNEPTCVVGEHRQFHLPLEDFLTSPCCNVGDIGIWECFLKEFVISKLGMSTLIFGGFCSTFGSIFFHSKMLPLLTMQQKCHYMKMNSH